MEISELIKEIRENKKLSQYQLGQILNVDQKTISRWESGTQTPSYTAIKAMCFKFDISADYLLGLTDDPEPHWEEQPQQLAEHYPAATHKDHSEQPETFEYPAAARGDNSIHSIRLTKEQAQQFKDDYEKEFGKKEK